MSTWEQKRNEMHRLIVRRSRLVSAASVLLAMLSVVLAIQMKKIAENRENSKGQMLIQELLQKQK